MPPFVCVGTSAANIGTGLPRPSAESSGSNMRRVINPSVVEAESNGLSVLGSSLTATRSTPAIVHEWRPSARLPLFEQPVPAVAAADNNAIGHSDRAFIAVHYGDEAAASREANDLGVHGLQQLRLAILVEIWPRGASLAFLRADAPPALASRLGCAGAGASNARIDHARRARRSASPRGERRHRSSPRNRTRDSPRSHGGDTRVR